MIDLLCISKGPIVGEYAKEQTRWILMNPEGTAEEIKGHLKNFQKKRDCEQGQAAQRISKKMHL
jgi:hypothetical protein